MINLHRWHYRHCCEQIKKYLPLNWWSRIEIGNNSDSQTRHHMVIDYVTYMTNLFGEFRVDVAWGLFHIELLSEYVIEKGITDVYVMSYPLTGSSNREIVRTDVVLMTRDRWGCSLGLPINGNPWLRDELYNIVEICWHIVWLWKPNVTEQYSYLVEEGGNPKWSWGGGPPILLASLRSSRNSSLPIW